MPSITKILVLAANPWDTKRLGLGEEYREISELWEKGKDENKFEVKHVPEARSEDLLTKLQVFKPNIVQFSGHGKVDGLLFTDDSGNAHNIDKALLVALFSMCTKHLHCVFLNACNSEQIAQAIAQNIDYAIGMNAEINDIAAVKFSKGFYRALFNGKEIKEAYQFALLELKLADFTSQQDIPVLYDRTAILINKEPSKPFVPNYQYDVLIHAAIDEKCWAESFKNELQKYLTQELNNQSCYLHLQTDSNVYLEKAALILFVVSDQYVNEYHDILSKLIKSIKKQFLISRSELCPSEFGGLSRYKFYNEKVDFSNAAEFQTLAKIIAQYLQNIKKEFEFNKTVNQDDQPLVFIHTEPNEADIALARNLKPLFRNKGLGCDIPNLKAYQNTVKLNQKNCKGVLIIYGEDDFWTRQRIEEYRRLKQRRKESLEIVMIYADCSKEAKNTDSVDIYDNVPVFPCPPEKVEELIKRFEEALKEGH
ncbi:MAG: CHAT domain-containing protein [Methylococcales bacterium]|nr:CHAT domain-containing protein [Methylococcales bacterium]